MSVDPTNESYARFSLEKVSYRIGDRTLLDSLTLTFPVAQFCGLIGHNGSGKSTLLKLLGRHLTASTGTIRLNETPLNHWSGREFARQVAYLPQALPDAEGMTVRELVAMGRYPWHGALGRFSADDQQHVRQAIEQVGLEHYADRQVDTLSGGEKQRAWIALQVAQNSRCLLLDEPTSALDIAHQVEVLALIKRLSQQQKLTVIAILHDINTAVRFCDHLVALKQGQMIAEGAAASLMTPDTLSAIYGIPMGVLQPPTGGAPVSFVC